MLREKLGGAFRREGLLLRHRTGVGQGVIPEPGLESSEGPPRHSRQKLLVLHVFTVPPTAWHSAV